jgi:endogenous inhibitor of DNA gyrase (YacG/DUF329 family)
MLDLQAKRTISKECPICKTSFTSSQSRETVFCSKKCHFLNTRNRNLTTCKLCGKDVIRTKCRTTKHKNIFCSCSCRAKYYIDQRTGYRRSKSEIFICNLIKNDFPHIVPLENRKDLLPCGYEIDIFISECQLAIELNGPCHYFNIYGDETLKKVQSRDAIKQAEIQQAGYKSIVLNINIANKKKLNNFLIEQYTSNIKPILDFYLR